MILVIGGRYQGKEAFAREKAAIGEDAYMLCADGRKDELKKALSAPLVLHLEGFIRQLMERGEDPEDFFCRLLEKNGGAVVTADEIGSGIVPVDPFDREYREVYGRLCQRAAAESEAVYRVVCGIGMRIK